MRIERSKLVEGSQYYMDSRRDIKGVFKGRDEDSIYFECEENDRYGLSAVRKGLTAFSDDDGFGGFLEVLLGDDLTDEDVQLLNTLEKIITPSCCLVL